MMLSGMCAVLASIAWAQSASDFVSGNRVNKHTYSSDDGRGDFAFINTYFCDADTSSADYKCAVDMKASCEGFDVHMVQSYVTKNGSETPGEWYRYMHQLHGNMTTWDQFMHYGTTFHASDLSAHLARFQEDGIPFMARKTTSGTILYSLLVQTPSAKVMEIVSTTAPSSSASLFEDWKDTECPRSHERSLAQIASLRAMSSMFPPSPSPGLPTLTAIGVNIAASAETVNGIGTWLKKYGISGSQSELHNDTTCAVAAITYTNAEVRYVSNPSARVGSRTVEQYEEMQMATHSDYVGQGTGWDAWMDNHWCVGVSHSKALDAVAKLWAADHEAWHAHKTPRVGSVRSVGFRGESIELNGVIDGSYLKSLKGFDFCTASTDPASVVHV
jgi:hypothetical protein